MYYLLNRSRLLILLSLLCAGSGKMMAQQVLWDNYQFSYLGINPAFTGERGYLGVTGLIGNQFTGGIRPQSVSQIVVADSPLGESLTNNIGFQGFNSNLGNINNVGLNLTYAYRFVGDGYKISVGADAGFLVQPNTIVNNAVNLVLPFAGLGALFSTEAFFLSASQPLAFVNESRIINGNKPIFLMGGSSFGDPEKVLLNVSSLVELNPTTNAGNGLDVNAKLWLGGRAGLGASLRSTGSTGFANLTGKMIYTLEYQFSTSIRLGLSLDQDPLQGIRTNPVVGNPPAVFQLAIIYRPVPDNATPSRFDYY